nr:immunoglobulin light chain junction region [Macaca mulatta]MOX41715.1 immunoglobulin light chain junction region [Macaca mulatta]MOX41775.1 immunoglobulin light chain junction region [Macaca mulatta]MOX41965.1 immunoglobulin light chain junction region [Macaca mulatta]MOX42369.1 immunoglobulin light chain junction region [Macaca mulatta]
DYYCCSYTTRRTWVF